MKLSAWLNTSILPLLLGASSPSLAQGNFWQQTGGPLGGDISCMLVESDTIIAGDRFNGTYISSDQGAHWAHSGPDSIPTLAILRHPNGSLFLGTSRHGIWRSTDGGGNWSQCGLSSSDVTAIAIDDSGSVLAATATSGIYRSTDTGISWSQRWATSDTIGALINVPNAGIFAATDWGVFRSTNNAIDWTRVFSANYEIHGPYTLAAGSPGGVFVGFAHEGSYFNCGTGVARSTNGGGDWTTSMVFLSWPWDCIYVRALAANQSGTLFAGTRRGVVRSTDGGATWQDVNSGLSDTTVSSLGVNPQGFIFAGTTTGGVYRSAQSTTAVPSAGDQSPQTFTLTQNYPNPFNPKTAIGFSVPYRCRVTLRLFDPLGRHVSTLFDGEALPGSYTVEWNAANSPSGVYFCRMETGKFAQLIKLLLIK